MDNLSFRQVHENNKGRHYITELSNFVISTLKDVGIKETFSIVKLVKAPLIYSLSHKVAMNVLYHAYFSINDYYNPQEHEQIKPIVDVISHIAVSIIFYSFLGISAQNIAIFALLKFSIDNVLNISNIKTINNIHGDFEGIAPEAYPLMTTAYLVNTILIGSTICKLIV